MLIVFFLNSLFSGQMDCVWWDDSNMYNYVLCSQVPHVMSMDKT